MEKIKLHRETTASFDIDAQKGFTPLCPKELPVPGGDEIVEELNAQAKFAKFRMGSKDVHPSNAVWIATEDEPQFTSIEGHKNADTRWNAHCMSGTMGAELLDGLPKVCEYNYFVFKGIEPDLHPFSPIYHDLERKMSTGVIEYLKQNGIKTVIVGGLALNSEDIPLCVGSGIIDLANADFNVILNLSATRGLGSKEGRNEFIEILKNKYKIEVVNNSSQIKNV